MKILFKILFFVLAMNVQAESKRVEVYENSQQYWTVIVGQSLSGICMQIRPSGKSSQFSCQQDILEKNPGAFINKDPNRLIAGKRLWLPGSYQAISKLDNRKFNIQKFNWGSIKTPK